jgi:AMP-polyphosphate phosphotransferase
MAGSSAPWYVRPVFETAEIGNRVGKEEYRRRSEPLRVDLINAQFDLQRAGFSVLLLIAGDDRVGCDDLIDTLHEWMDARYLDTQVFLEPTGEEGDFPRFWRYWRTLPAHGRIGVLLGAWSLRALAERMRKQIDDVELDRRIEHIQRLEEALAEDGTLILKFWLHLPPRKLAKRLKKADKDPDLAARLDELDWGICRSYERLRPLAERFVLRTDTEHARWYVVESTDARYRDLTVAETLRAALLERLAAPAAPPADDPPMPPPSIAGGRTILDAVDIGAALDDATYEKKLARLQADLRRLSIQARQERRSSVVVFEGWDAAGKGGAIRRMTRPMAARDYVVVPIAAPTDEERAHHYLWRFWRRLPRPGRMAIFDRSWYGRVLVERVEGFAREDEWLRAYEEINDFEDQLVEHGMLVLKFWLHIDAGEQLRRFQARAKTPYKKYKLTDEDYRNRGKRDLYAAAVNEMVARTSTDRARWHIVPANDKRFARVEVLRTACDGLERLLGS